MMKTFSALVFFDTWDGARVGERALRDEGYSTRMHDYVEDEYDPHSDALDIWRTSDVCLGKS
jgi:hypothetical protein